MKLHIQLSLSGAAVSTQDGAGEAVAECHLKTPI